LKPWGAVQLYCCGFSRLTRKKLRTTLPTIPFFDTINPDIKSHHSKRALSLAEQNELILARIDSLELFLQEYVVDVHYLDSVRDRLISSKAIFNSTMNNQEFKGEFDILNTSSTNSTVSTVTQQQEQQGFVSPNFSTSNNFTTVKYD
jgi:hypothetical protein